MRALSTLMRWLTPDQAGELARVGSFTVRGSDSGARYTIHPWVRVGNVDRVRRINTGSFGTNEGVESMLFCAVSPGVPVADQALLQKLMIENDEKEFLRIAHVLVGICSAY